MSATSSSGSATGAAATHSPPRRSDVEPCAGHTDRYGPLIVAGGAEPLTVTATAAGCADQSESDAPAAAPAVARLYRHALESVFAFLALREVALALRVSRGWLAAVGSMRRLELAVRQPNAPLAVLARSTMSRHVIALGGGLFNECLRFDTHTLSILADRMAHLRHLSCWFDPPLPGQMAFPSSLRRLDVRMCEPTSAAEINAGIAAIARLPLLEELGIMMDALDPHLSFAPLAALPLLRCLHIDLQDSPDQPSDAQVDQLRALPRLQQLNVPMSTSLLRRLLRQPHDLQWQDVSLPYPLDDEAAALLPQLPSLTKIVEYVRCERFDWLRGLPNLADVCLSSDEEEPPAGRAALLVAALQCCTKIELLLLGDLPDLTATQLGELLSRLPRLRELLLDRLSIDSLSFVAQPPLTSQLRRLELWHCRWLPPAELRHVHSLRGLKTLKLFSAFAEPLDDDAQSLLKPPSAVMPLLEDFVCNNG